MQKEQAQNTVSDTVLEFITQLNDIFVPNTPLNELNKKIDFEQLNELVSLRFDYNFVAILSSFQTRHKLSTENMQLLFLDDAHSSDQIRTFLDNHKYRDNSQPLDNEASLFHQHIISFSTNEHIIFLVQSTSDTSVVKLNLEVSLNIIAPLVNRSISGSYGDVNDSASPVIPEKLLFEISELANVNVSLDQFYAQIHQKLNKLIYAKNLFILLHNDKDEQIRFVYYKDELDHTPIEDMQKIPFSQIKQSLTGYVFSTQTALLATTTEIALLAKFGSIKPQGPMTKSWLGVPLKLDDKIIGVLALQSYDEKIVYSEQDKLLVEYFSKSLSEAIDRKTKQSALEQLVEKRTLQLKQINQDLTREIAEKTKAESLQNALYDISLLASGAEDMTTFYRSIHAILGELFKTDNFYIALKDPNKELLDIVYFVDEKDQAKFFYLDLKKNTMSTVLFRLNKPVLLQQESYPNFADTHNIKRMGSPFVSWLGVPLINDQQSLGIMVVQSYDDDYHYGTWQRDLMQFVARQVTVALQRKRDKTNLEHEVRARTAALEDEIDKHKKSKSTQVALYKIANLANEDIRLNTFYNELHKIITQLIYSENFYIALLNPNGAVEMAYYADTMDDFDLSTFADLTENKLRYSITGYVIRNGEPLLATQSELRQLSKDEQFILIGEETVSWLGVPLFLNGQTIGVMTVQSYLADKVYTEQDRDLMIFVAQHVATAIQRKRHNDLLEVEVNQRTKELTTTNKQLQVEIKQREESERLQTALYNIAETSLLCDTQFDLYSELHKIVGQLMYANSFYIATLDHENQLLNFEYFVDESGDSAPASQPLGNSLTSYTIRQEKILHVNKQEIMRFEKEGIIDHVGTYAIDWVGVPLTFGDAVFGIMALQSYDPNHVYKQRDIDILSFVSSHIAEVLERKRSEDALQNAYLKLEEKTLKAQAANEAKSRFLATVSHEIRTPMNGILGMLSLLSDTKISRRQKDYISKLTNSADTLLHIINDILDFSKIEEGKLKLEQVSFSLIEMLDNLLDLFSSRIAEKRLEFTVDLPADINERRFGDPLRISQILINLVGNAIKFTHQGYICIKVTEPEPNQLQFDVEDSGIGIPEEKQQLIFESFTQADNTTTRQFGGSGLGLSICQQLVNLMDGCISVKHNSKHSGSVFQFRIDAPAIDKRHPISTRHTSKQLKPKLILISDDKKQTLAWEKYCARENLELLSLVSSNYSDDVNLESISKYTQKIGERPLMIFINHSTEQSISKKSFELFRNQMPTYTSFFIMTASEHYKEMNLLVNHETRLLRKPIKMSTLNELIDKANVCATDTTPIQHVDSLQKLRLNGIKILLAEDNRVNQMVARGMLEKEGAIVQIVDNGQSAVNQVKQQNFDLVLMDMQMPVMDGYIASQTIREFRTAEQLAIIAMTANVMKGDKEKCLENGMNDYIGKPIDRERLVKIILYYANPVQTRSEKSVNSNVEFDLERYKYLYQNEQLFSSALALIHEQHVNDVKEIENLIAAKDYLDAATLVTHLNHSLLFFNLNRLEELTEAMLSALCRNNCPTQHLYQEYLLFVEQFFAALRRQTQ
jgi:signal transduction histidine kinase/CheY-like chemotaxis protein/putative methionine-R-sulfoxide reductase with GAF domain